jgi:murein DD-endopeptidase MepM/ murein hydrolase activator NlpD
MAGGNGRDRAADRIVFEFGRHRTIVSLPRHGVLFVSLFVGALFAWSLASGFYVAFHDTVIGELQRGAKASERGYEAQLSTLRDELDRVRTRRLIERSGVDERLAEIGRRQQALEKRQIKLAELAEPVRADAGLGPHLLSKPTPIGSGAALDDVSTPQAAGAAARASERMSSILDDMEATQARTLEGLATKASQQRRQIERVYDAVRAPKPQPASSSGDAAAGRGGPFEPIPANGYSFDARVEAIAAEREAIEALMRGLSAVPLRTPAPGASISSGFGVRRDPFLGQMAFHSGIDFEESAGELVRATAAGRVVNAGWSGGYGNMVEIDHGGGLSTRFGHMSAITVTVGQRVEIGSVVGRVGSTGRSTGPHLHYETRQNGEAVDPIRFLNAGRLLAAAL